MSTNSNKNWFATKLTLHNNSRSYRGAFKNAFNRYCSPVMQNKRFTFITTRIKNWLINIIDSSIGQSPSMPIVIDDIKSSQSTYTHPDKSYAEKYSGFGQEWFLVRNPQPGSGIIIHIDGHTGGCTYNDNPTTSTSSSPESDQHSFYSAKKIEEQLNRCGKCGIDMGPSNPRQLCGKTYCKDENVFSY
jgi:hypothetical protein